jgi:MFS family permease
MADVLDGDRYAVATSLTNITTQLAQVFGFVLAGGLIAVFDPSAALLIDAATFAISALWLSRGLRRRPAPLAEAGAERRSLWQDTGDGLRLIGRTPRLLVIVSLLWVGNLFGYAWEGIATPLTDELGQGATGLGIVLAANPLGVALGGLVLARLVPPAVRERLVTPLVVLSLAPLLAGGIVAFVAGPGTVPFAVLVLLLFVSGLGAAWVIPLNVSFVQAVPSAFRGRAFGVAVSGLYGVQGIGALAAGGIAEGLRPSMVVALCGGLGLIAVLPSVIGFRRTQGHIADAAAAEGPSTS